MESARFTTSARLMGKMARFCLGGSGRCGAGAALCAVIFVDKSVATVGNFLVIKALVYWS